jgi:hypothetical protein
MTMTAALLISKKAKIRVADEVCQE